jgi:hypothetical protein
MVKHNAFNIVTSFSIRIKPSPPLLQVWSVVGMLESAASSMN